MHFGEITFGVDERGEVGLLTRNIRIQASDDAEQLILRRAHHGDVRVEDVRLRRRAVNRMGQHMHLARYPIHWHLIGEGQGQYIRNASIHDTYSRCVTVHGTNNLQVENNVTFNTVGHCFFLEDGSRRATSSSTTSASRPSVIRPCRASRPTSTAGSSVAAGRPAIRPYPDPVGQHGVDLLDHQSGQRLPRQRGRGVRPDRLLDRLAAASDGRSSKARRSAPRPGRAGRGCASSAAISPTPTSMA